VFIVTPSIYTPRFSHRAFPGLGFGIRHLGYGFGPAYYGFGYAPSLFCETTFDCDFVPMIGVVDVPPYESVAPYQPPSAPDLGSGSVRVDVQPRGIPRARLRAARRRHAHRRRPPDHVSRCDEATVALTRGASASR
jgi:hypothetical protein